MSDAEGGDGLGDLEIRFDAAMYDIYERAGRELQYWATRYLQMLRRNGGLETARRLLAARATSDGYKHLREAGRLDLTVEALVLHAEFRSLFTSKELSQARARLAYYRSVMETETQSAEPPDPRLLSLLEDVAGTPPNRRVEYRDQVATFGVAAIPPLLDWVAAGNSPGFACVTLEAIGRASDARTASRALLRLRSDHPEWASVIDDAISRIR